MIEHTKLHNNQWKENDSQFFVQSGSKMERILLLVRFKISEGPVAPLCVDPRQHDLHGHDFPS